tara:strand:- start:248 stop:418 length:171 start_codon:yes stop_codon:yes gene_type:complete
MGDTMGLELVIFFMLVLMASIGYGTAYLQMRREIRVREIEIGILYHYIETGQSNDR